jgi:hypothetical protein
LDGAFGAALGAGLVADLGAGLFAGAALVTVFLGGATFFTVFLTTAFLAEAWGVDFLATADFLVAGVGVFLAGTEVDRAADVARDVAADAFLAAVFFVGPLAVDGIDDSLDGVYQRADPSSRRCDYAR